MLTVIQEICIYNNYITLKKQKIYVLVHWLFNRTPTHSMDTVNVTWEWLKWLAPQHRALLYAAVTYSGQGGCNSNKYLKTPCPVHSEQNAYSQHTVCVYVCGFAPSRLADVNPVALGATKC